MRLAPALASVIGMDHTAVGRVGDINLMYQLSVGALVESLE